MLGASRSASHGQDPRRTGDEQPPGQPRPDHRPVGDVAALSRRLVVTASCKAAVKLNDPLTVPAMERLVADLWATDSPTTCPHGRPVVFRLTVSEIERAFRRR